MEFQLVNYVRPVVEALRLYHQHEVIGIENIPKTGPGIIVVNHSLATYDILLLWVTVLNEHDRLIRGLVDRLFFKIPFLGEIVSAGGAAEGTANNAKELLQKGELICIAPGGMKESLRTPSQRYKIDWENRKGFVRLAISEQVPIILAACPLADDLYDVIPLAITEQFYERFKIPVFLAKGLGLTPLPRPIRLTHFVAKPVFPPKIATDADESEVVNHFHLQIVRKMKRLMNQALRHAAKNA
jgi:hypothetical protein